MPLQNFIIDSNKVFLFDSTLNWSNAMDKKRKKKKTNDKQKEKATKTNKMVINIYCYYSFNAIWQAVEWTNLCFLFVFAGVAVTAHRQTVYVVNICIQMKWNAKGDIQIGMK